MENKGNKNYRPQCKGQRPCNNGTGNKNYRPQWRAHRQVNDLAFSWIIFFSSPSDDPKLRTTARPPHCFSRFLHFLNLHFHRSGTRKPERPHKDKEGRTKYISEKDKDRSVTADPLLSSSLDFYPMCQNSGFLPFKGYIFKNAFRASSLHRISQSF